MNIKIEVDVVNFYIQGFCMQKRRGTSLEGR